MWWKVWAGRFLVEAVGDWAGNTLFVSSTTILNDNERGVKFFRVTTS